MDYHYRSYNFTRTTKDIHEFSIVKEKKNKQNTYCFDTFFENHQLLFYSFIIFLIFLNGKIRQKGIHEFSIVKEKKKKFRSSLFFFFETQRHFLIYKKLEKKNKQNTYCFDTFFENHQLLFYSFNFFNSFKWKN
jgi:hypothetical protein